MSCAPAPPAAPAATIFPPGAIVTRLTESEPAVKGVSVQPSPSKVVSRLPLGL
jgi:hypothetical protein